MCNTSTAIRLLECSILFIRWRLRNSIGGDVSGNGKRSEYMSTPLAFNGRPACCTFAAVLVRYRGPNHRGITQTKCDGRGTCFNLHQPCTMLRAECLGSVLLYGLQSFLIAACQRRGSVLEVFLPRNCNFSCSSPLSQPCFFSLKALLFQTNRSL